MAKRADQAAATRARILQAAAEAMRVRFRPNVRLDEIASAAGVSVQTVLRIFGSRAGLLDAVTETASEDVAAEFVGVVPGEVENLVHAYFNHYEKVGDLVVANIADETEPDLRAFVAKGRAMHREHVAAHFAARLAERTDEDRRRLVDGLVCALDVYVWKLLRRDTGRSRPDAEAVVITLIRALLKEPT